MKEKKQFLDVPTLAFVLIKLKHDYNALEGGCGWGVIFPGRKHYEGVRFNIISVMMGVCGCHVSRKKHYATLEWPLISRLLYCNAAFLQMQASINLLYNHSFHKIIACVTENAGVNILKYTFYLSNMCSN